MVLERELAVRQRRRSFLTDSAYRSRGLASQVQHETAKPCSHTAHRSMYVSVAPRTAKIGAWLSESGGDRSDRHARVRALACQKPWMLSTQHRRAGGGRCRTGGQPPCPFRPPTPPCTHNCLRMNQALSVSPCTSICRRLYNVVTPGAPLGLPQRMRKAPVCCSRKRQRLACWRTQPHPMSHGQLQQCAGQEA